MTALRPIFGIVSLLLFLWFPPVSAASTPSRPLSSPPACEQYLYAHANPVNGWDPSGHETMANVGMAITIGTSLHSALAFAQNPTWIAAGALALDAAQVGKLRHVAKGLFSIKNAISLRHIANAFPGGINALRRYQLTLKSTTVGTHTHLAKELADNALSLELQANHLNQVAAFTRIPRGQGLAIPLKGHATEAGTQHNKFHAAMEEFWDRYRANRNLQPDADEYAAAVEQALRAADIDATDAVHLAEATVAQAKHFKYFTPNGPRITIPERFLPRP